MRKPVIAGIFIVAALATTVWIAPGSLARPGYDVFDQIDLLVDVRHEIVHHYVEQPDERRMIEQAVRAMVGALDDRYTVFLTAQELDPFDKQVRGSFSGIGAEIDIHHDRLRIVSPLEDSPAWNAGVMAGDIVLEIDGESTEGISITDAVSKLTGPEGTQVTIRVRHESGEEQTIAITRARINVQTVRGIRRDSDNSWDYMIDDANRIGYIRITQFTNTTAQSVEEALQLLAEDEMQGLILDLRFNPGGLLESAVAVADLFLEAGQSIVSVKGRTVTQRVHESSRPDTIGGLPIVVLANEASASAAEIVTGALSDNKRAMFIGSRTFGKGSVQQVKMLENGLGALKITHAYYYLPNGRNIHRREGQEVWGVDPDDGFYVPMTAKQVKQMIEIRRDSNLLRAGGVQDLPAVTPQWIEQELGDFQLAAGLRAMLGRIAQDHWPAVGQSGAELLVRQSMRDNLIRQRDLLNERLELVRQELAKLDDQGITDESVATQTAQDAPPQEPLSDQPGPQVTDDQPDGPDPVEQDHSQP